jgi:hypothetical protein
VKPAKQQRNGRRKSKIKHFWGEVEVTVQRLRSVEGSHSQMFVDASLDQSGWSPWALEQLLYLVVHHPFEEASSLAARFGLSISSSELERLSKPYLQCSRQQIQTTLTTPALEQEITSPELRTQSTQKRQTEQGSKRIMVLQTDGVFVLKRPEHGYCEGMEIKSAVLYPQNAPQDRVMLAEGCSATKFLPLLSGLLQRFCSQQDFIVGLGDGAPWVEDSLDLLADIRITDVFHSCQYLDTLMQALLWDEAKRAQHRRAWCQGEVSAHGWLQQHLPLPDHRHTWSDQANTALDYFTARLEHMDYPAFKANGYPIGSGQVEAMNKNVIGNRLKRSGMHWSKQGASAMAASRALAFSKVKLCAFDQLRFLAYPTPA